MLLFLFLIVTLVTYLWTISAYFYVVFEISRKNVGNIELGALQILNTN